MASKKFALAESPFAKINDRNHHQSDQSYEKYKATLSCIPNEEGSEVNEGNSGASSSIGVAIFGAGRAGTIHMNNILASVRAELLYIVDENETRLTAVRQSLNSRAKDIKCLRLHEASEVVWADSRVHVCIIATPTATHEDLITKSLESGKAVFAEKPLAETVERTRKVYEIAERLKRPLFCAFNRRFDPSFISVRQSVLKGEIGHVHQIRTTSRDSPLPSIEYLKISGGIFHDCAVHDVDMITWILGELPDEVFSYGNAMIPEIASLGDFDNITCNLKFPSGTIGSIDISRFASYGYDQRVEVFGPKGMMISNNSVPNSTLQHTSSGIISPPIFWSFPSRYQEGYVNELNHFLDVVLGLDEMTVTAKTTLAVSKITTALEDSARNGAPVKLVWTKDEIPEGFSA